MTTALPATTTLPETTTLPVASDIHAVAEDLLRRWDRQQTAFIRHRALRFDTIARVVAATCGASPRILDLASGPGSLTAALREAIPGSEVVALDKDPVLVRIARDALAHDPRVHVVEADLDTPAWLDAVISDHPFDAIVSSTALHWLSPDVLARVYVETTSILRPGGILLNGDHLYYDAVAAPTLRQVAADDAEAFLRSEHAAGAEDWDSWWRAAESVPEYVDAVRERARRWEGSTPPLKVTLGYHLEALRSAGFVETGTVWQFLDDWVLYGIR